MHAFIQHRGLGHCAFFSTAFCVGELSLNPVAVGSAFCRDDFCWNHHDKKRCRHPNRYYSLLCLAAIKSYFSFPGNLCLVTAFCDCPCPWHWCCIIYQFFLSQVFYTWKQVFCICDVASTFVCRSVILDYTASHYNFAFMKRNLWTIPPLLLLWAQSYVYTDLLLACVI